MKEATHVWALLKRQWERSCHLTRVENAASGGIPDVNGLHIETGVEFWVETKVERNKTIGSFDLRPSQTAWFTRRTSVGGKHHFVVSRNDDYLHLWKPRIDPVGGLIFTLAYSTGMPFNYDELLHRIVSKTS